MSPSALSSNPMECPMPQSNDLSRSFTAFDQDSTLIAVIEMSQSNWLVAGLVPGIERQPLKKLSPDEDELLKLVQRWRNEAAQAGRGIKRIVLAYEAGRDGFWLARWLRRRGIEAYVIHPSSVAVSREHRRAKTDRLDTELLMRAFLGWLRGEKRHCSMAAIPTIEDEDAKRPSREHEKLVGDRTRLVNRMKAMLARFGIRTFKPTLRKAEERLDGLCTAEGTPLPEEHARGAAPRYDAVAHGARADQGHRARAPAQAHGGSRGERSAGDGSLHRADHRDRHRDGGHARERDPVARLAGQQGGRPLCRPHWRAGRERQEATGEGSRQGGQRASAARHDPVRLASSHLPEG